MELELKIKRKLLIISILILSVLAFGTIGYMLIEGINVLDALYMTVITVATVGFREVTTLSSEGKVFTIILIFCGFGVFTYAATVGAQILVEGEIKEIFKKRRMRKGIKKLSNHYIVCGYGRMGEIICEELKTNNVPFVVVDKNEEMLKEREDILYIIGDATKDEILKEAGIERAKGIVSVLSTDAENLYVVLSARAMNPKLFIVARAAEEEAKNKLKIAGADRVVCPYHIGGLRIAQTLLRPNVVDFLEFVTRSEYLDIQIEEIEVSSKASFVGKSLGEAGIGKDLGVIIVGIKRADGRMEFNPSARTVINSGDILIVIGPRERLAFLTEIAAGED
jgi:voltage-gated potassium channel